VRRSQPLPDIVLVDAFRVPDSADGPARRATRGFADALAIAAASIIAKVTRDRLMLVAPRPRSTLWLRPTQGLRDADHVDAVARFGYSDPSTFIPSGGTL